MIALNYLKLWFVLDVLATFPYFLLNTSTFGGLNFLFRAPRFLRILRFLRLLKLLKSSNSGGFMEDLEYSPKVHPGLFRSLKLFFVALIFSHFSACFWWFLGDESDPDSWIVRCFNFKEKDPLYTQSIGYKVDFFD
jgi:hypothetical protein